MADEGPMAIVAAALADPVTLLVFGVIVAGTSTARVVDDFERTSSGTPYLTLFGLTQTTSLPREAVERAAERLLRAGLLDVLSDDGRGFDSWRVNEAVWAAASARKASVG